MGSDGNSAEPQETGRGSLKVKEQRPLYHTPHLAWFFLTSEMDAAKVRSTSLCSGTHCRVTCCMCVWEEGCRRGGKA